MEFGLPDEIKVYKLDKLTLSICNSLNSNIDLNNFFLKNINNRSICTLFSFFFTNNTMTIDQTERKIIYFIV